MESYTKLERITLIIVFIFLIGFAFRIYQPLSTGHIVGVDGYYHMQMAELYKAGDFSNIQKYPPGTHVIIAGFSMITGLNTEFSSFFLSSLFSSLIIVAVFLLVKENFGMKAGLLSALFIALSGELVSYGARVKNLDFVIPLLIFGLWLNERDKKISFAAIVIVISLFSPFDAALLCLISILSVAMRTRKDVRRKKISRISMILLLLAFSILIGTIYVTDSLSSLYIEKNVPAEMSSVLFYMPGIWEFFSRISPFLISFAAAGLFFSIREKKSRYIMIPLALLAMIFPFGVMETDRWYVYFSIFLAFFAGYGLEKFISFVEKIKKFHLAEITIAAILISGIWLSFLGLESNSWGVMNNQRYSVYQWLSSNTHNDSVVLGTIDESHWILGIGKRKPVSSANLIQQSDFEKRFSDMKTAYITNSSTERGEILKKYNVKYILISDKTYFYFGDVRMNFQNSDFFLAYENDPYEIYYFVGQYNTEE